MENQSSHKSSNFWFGFALGIIAAGGAAYLFGTKKGRKKLQQFMELSENLEENVASFLEEVGIDFKEKTSEEIKKLQPTFTALKKDHPSLNRLLDKIKILSPQEEKKGKKFFVKE